MQSNQGTSHLASLDGFRACLALWVYLGHLASATGFANWLLDRHALAVDLFMVLSGFLMVHTWRGDVRAATFASAQTLRFYIGRIFRIAPPYYFLLAICSLFLTDLATMHDAALRTIPPPWAADLEHFEPRTEWHFANFRWLWTHLTLMFGLFPGLESSTPLPDWSLSLEMQFYLALPLMLVMLRKIPMIALAIFASTLAMVAPVLFGSYLTPGEWAHFGQPSFLPYRLNAFVAGMVVALWLRSEGGAQRSRTAAFRAALAAAICLIPLSKLVILGFVLFALLVTGRVPWVSRILSLKPMRLLGEVSYSLYLAHLLIVIPVVFMLVRQPWFISLPPVQRFAVALAPTLPMVVAVSYALYRSVELPSIRLGKRLTSRLLS